MHGTMAFLPKALRVWCFPPLLSLPLPPSLSSLSSLSSLLASSLKLESMRAVHGRRQASVYILVLSVTLKGFQVVAASPVSPVRE